MAGTFRTVSILAMAFFMAAASAGSWGDDANVEKLFSEALKADGSEYQGIRDRIVLLGEAALPFLRRQATHADWHVATIAVAIAGRIEKPEIYRSFEEEVKAAVAYASRAHPWPPDTILGSALEPISPFPSGQYSAGWREETRKRWGGSDGTAFMVEGMLKGHTTQTPPVGKKSSEDRHDLWRDFCTARLGISTQPVALTALLEALQSQELEGVARAAVAAFRGIEKDKAEGPLVVLLNSTARPQQDYVVQALANIKSEHAASFLPALVDNGDSFRITQQLVEIGGPKAVQALLKLLGHSNQFVRGHAAERLGQMKAIEAIGPLIDALQDPSGQVPAGTAQALGALRDARATAALIAALEGSPSWQVRSGAAQGLGLSGDRRAVPALVQAATDESSDVRKWSITALAQIGDPSAADVILAGLKDSSVEVRVYATRAQSLVKDPRAIEPLIDMLAHGVYEEKLPAKLALHDITGVYRDDAEQWQKWWSANKEKFRDGNE